MNGAEPKLTATTTKLVSAVLVAATIGVLYHQFADRLTLDNLAEQESALRDYQQQHPVLVFGLAFALYVTVTGLSLPGAVPLSLGYGWFFGLVPAFVMVSFASTSGATIAFLLSRYFFRDAIQRRFGDRLDAFNESLAKEGAFYLFTLRLIPAVPFFVINVVMGLTPMRVWTFWWVSQIGMLAGTFIFIYAGSSVPDLKTLAQQGTGGIVTPQLLIAFSLLGLFPITVRKILQAIGNPSIQE